MDSNRRRLLVLAAATPLIPAARAAGGGPASAVTQELRVTGVVEHPLRLTVAGLGEMPSQVLAGVPLRGRDGTVKRMLDGYRGVLLRDVLDKASIVSRDHNDVKRMVVIARASDGYTVVFSWNEIYNSAVGDGVLVLIEKDGRPLEDFEGRVALVSTTDRQTGPRHVRWLKSLEVRRLDR